MVDMNAMASTLPIVRYIGDAKDERDGISRAKATAKIILQQTTSFEEKNYTKCKSEIKQSEIQCNLVFFFVRVVGNEKNCCKPYGTG